MSVIVGRAPEVRDDKPVAGYLCNVRFLPADATTPSARSVAETATTHGDASDTPWCTGRCATHAVARAASALPSSQPTGGDEVHRSPADPVVAMEMLRKSTSISSQQLQS